MRMVPRSVFGSTSGVRSSRRLRTPGVNALVGRRRSMARFLACSGPSCDSPGPTARFRLCWTGQASRAIWEAILVQLAAAYPRAGESRVIGWWHSLPNSPAVPPPLPAWSSATQVLATLRESWLRPGDLLALDHRQPQAATRFELVGSGASWLGPTWSLIGSERLARAPQPVTWHTDSVSDLAEWSYRQGGFKLTRTAVMLRGRRMALLADQVDGKALTGQPLEVRFTLPQAVTTEAIADSRGLLLRSPRARSSAQVLPLALPALPYETDRGRFCALPDASALSLGLVPRGRRCWLPLLVSWDPARHRKRLSWRVLTVSERSGACPPDVAFAVRVSWGREDTLVIYRSLAAPASRAFLGHQTKARFLIGRFTTEGIVEPLVSVD